MTSLKPLLTHLQSRGITVTVENGMLNLRPASRLDPGTVELLRQHKHALVALLRPSRDTAGDDCPDHWLFISPSCPRGAHKRSQRSMANQRATV